MESGECAESAGGVAAMATPPAAAVVTGRTATGAARGRTTAGQAKLAKANRRGTVIGQELSEIQAALTGGKGGADNDGATPAPAESAGIGVKAAERMRPKPVSDDTGNLVPVFKACVTRFAGFSHKGYAAYNKEKQNQDRLVMHQDPASQTLFFAVFDGHGPVGEKVSQVFKAYCAKRCFDKLNQEKPLTHKEAIAQSIKETEDVLMGSTLLAPAGLQASI